LCRWCLALWAIFSICSLSLNVFPSFRVFPQQRWLRVSAQVKVRCRFWRFQKVLVQIPGKYSGSGGSRVVIPQSFHVICFQTVSFVSQVWWRVLWFRDGVLWNWFPGAISQRFSVLSKVFPPCCCKLASSCFPLVTLLVSLH